MHWFQKTLITTLKDSLYVLYVSNLKAESDNITCSKCKKKFHYECENNINNYYTKSPNNWKFGRIKKYSYQDIFNSIRTQFEIKKNILRNI